MSNKSLKLHLGCGAEYLEGWINIDLDPEAKADLYQDVGDLHKFGDNSAEAICASHLLEHIDLECREIILKEWYRVLKSGGWLVLEVPDLEKICDLYLRTKDEKIRKSILVFMYGNHHAGLNGHKYGYSKQSLTNLLNKIGFKEIYFSEPRNKIAAQVAIRCDAKK